MIHVVYRTYKVIKDDKPRPEWFSKELCFNSIANPIFGDGNFKLHILFNGESKDTLFSRPELSRYADRTKYIEGNNAAESYLEALHYSINLPTTDWVYLVEDDYLHHRDWPDVLRKMTLFNNYLTLYDHPDKYNTTIYSDLKSELVYAQNVLCRTVPSTTDTFCVPVKMLLSDYRIHETFSRNVPYSLDHQRFICLGDMGRKIYSPIPGYSVHCHEPYCNVREDYFD